MQTPLTDRINNDFTYHRPDESKTDRMAAIREQCRITAILIAETTPAGREQALALTNLEQVSMWANAAIARN